MNEANVPPNRKSQDNRSAAPKRPTPHASTKPSSRGLSKKEARSRKAKSDQPSASPVTQRPASVPGWQVVEFPSVISAAPKPHASQSPASRESVAKEEQPSAQTRTVRSSDGRSPSSSQTTGSRVSPSVSAQPPAPEALIALIQDANQRNHALLNRIADLEGALAESRQALQVEMERASDEDEEAIAPQSGAETSQQVNYLLNQLEFAQQTTQRQEILIETLTGQLQASQERVGQIEREYQGLQAQVEDSTGEIHQVRSRCRELQTRLQRQQRYTLQFKAALEKCLEVPPPSYETGHTAPSAVQVPLVDPENLIETAETSEGSQMSGSTIPFPTLRTGQPHAPENVAPSLDAGSPLLDKNVEETQDAAAFDLAANAAVEKQPQAQERQALAAVEPSSQFSTEMRMPSLFPKTAQIRPWSATDAESDGADDGKIGRIPLDRELEPEATTADGSERSPATSGDRPSKFYETLLELASVDLGEASSPHTVSAPSAASDHESSAEISVEPTDPVDRVDPQALSSPAASQQATQKAHESEAHASSESQVIAMPDGAAAARRTQSQPVIGSILPPDLKKERQATPQGSDYSDHSDHNVAAQTSGNDPRGTAPFSSKHDPDFPASFSILRPDVGEGIASRAEAQSEPSEADETDVDPATLDGLWRDLAHLVDASTDDILKAKQTDVFEPSMAEPNRLSGSDASMLDEPFGSAMTARQKSGSPASAKPEADATTDGEKADAAIAQNRIPPFSVSQSDSAKTEATLAALARQSYQSPPLVDLWLDPEPDAALAEDGDRSTAPESTTERSTTPLVEKSQPGVEEEGDRPTAQQFPKPPSAISQPGSSQAPSIQPPSIEAKLPNLMSHHVDDWVSDTSASSPASPDNVTAGAELESSSQGKPPGQPNWPAPLLDPERLKQKKPPSSVDLPAFLR